MPSARQSPRGPDRGELHELEPTRPASWPSPSTRRAPSRRTRPSRGRRSRRRRRDATTLRGAPPDRLAFAMAPNRRSASGGPKSMVPSVETGASRTAPPGSSGDDQRAEEPAATPATLARVARREVAARAPPRRALRRSSAGRWRGRGHPAPRRAAGIELPRTVEESGGPYRSIWPPVFMGPTYRIRALGRFTPHATPLSSEAKLHWPDAPDLLHDVQPVRWSPPARRCRPRRRGPLPASGGCLIYRFRIPMGGSRCRPSRISWEAAIVLTRYPGLGLKVAVATPFGAILRGSTSSRRVPRRSGRG